MAYPGSALIDISKQRMASSNLSMLSSAAPLLLYRRARSRPTPSTRLQSSIALSWYGREPADLPDMCMISPIFSCAWSAFSSKPSAFRQQSSASASLPISMSIVALFTYRKGESGLSRIIPSKYRRALAMLFRSNMRTTLPRSTPGLTTPSKSSRRPPSLSAPRPGVPALPALPLNAAAPRRRTPCCMVAWRLVQGRPY